MLKNKLRTLLLLSAIAIASCNSNKPARTPNTTLDIMYHMMSGHYDSQAQSLQDTSYFDITLRMEEVPVMLPGKWLYVEQAVSSKLDAPYRVRMYQLEQVNDSLFRSKIYTLKDQERYIGHFESQLLFSAMTWDDLEIRDGCAVYMTAQNDGSFSGSTKEKECGSTLYGATYATSSVYLDSKKIISWDQGFDANDKQVWGATKGGYIFIKK